MEDDIQTYIKVKGYGSLLSDLCIGYNVVRKKFYKMALHDGKFRVIEASKKDGPWKMKNDGLGRFTPTRIVTYTNAE
jgi:hypothetical protein